MYDDEIEDQDSPPEQSSNDDFSPPVVTLREQGIKDLVGEESNFGFFCDNCAVQDTCPQYEAHASCNLKFAPDETNPPKVMEYLVMLQLTRIRRAVYMETQKGGMLDPALSQEISRLMGMLPRREGSKITLEATGDAASNSGGLLSALLGGGNEANKQEKEIG